MSHAPSAALSSRHHAIRRESVTRALDALVITSLSNVLYLTNFTGSAAIAVLTADRLYFITDFRYVTTLADMAHTPFACPGLELVRVEGSYDATLAGLLASLPANRLRQGYGGPPRLSAETEATPETNLRIGFESAHLTVSRHQWLTRALPRGATSGPELLSTEGIVEAARVLKDDHEIATLREAARRLSQVARDVFGDVKRGRSERDLALAIDWRIRQAGFERCAFDTIVAAGPNAALPHATPSERKLTEGDLVVLDFGGVYNSYCVDLTRTVSIGRAGPRSREVYDAVLKAHDRAIAAVAPGRSRFEVDAAARDTLTRLGLGDAFGHGTGHGLGIDVHEEPRIARRRPGVDTQHEALESRMVFTIEPGAYLPGWGGVRIEDDVLVTDDGVEVLTDVTTELIEI